MKSRQKHLKVLAEITQIEVAFIEECLAYDVIALKDIESKQIEISPSHLAKLRRIQRICRGLEVDILAGSIIVDLLDRINEMEQKLGLLSQTR